MEPIDLKRKTFLQGIERVSVFSLRYISDYSCILNCFLKLHIINNRFVSDKDKHNMKKGKIVPVDFRQLFRRISYFFFAENTPEQIGINIHGLGRSIRVSRKTLFELLLLPLCRRYYIFDFYPECPCRCIDLNDFSDFPAHKCRT